MAYDLALFLHISGVLALYAALTVETVGLRGLRRATTGDQARLWLGVMQPLRWLGAAAGVLILLPGLYMAATAGFQGWTAVGLVGLVVMAVMGAALTGSRMARVGPVLGRWNGPFGPDQFRAARDAGLLTSLSTRALLGLGIVYVMTVKPDFLGSAIVATGAAIVGAVGGYVLSREPSGEAVAAGAADDGQAAAH